MNSIPSRRRQDKATEAEEAAASRKAVRTRFADMSAHVGVYRAELDHHRREMRLAIDALRDLGLGELELRNLPYGEHMRQGKAIEGQAATIKRLLDELLADAALHYPGSDY